MFKCPPATLFLLLGKLKLLQGVNLVFVKKGNMKGWRGLVAKDFRGKAFEAR